LSIDRQLLQQRCIALRTPDAPTLETLAVEL
jgi:hypothetical protein